MASYFEQITNKGKQNIETTNLFQQIVQNNNKSNYKDLEKKLVEETSKLKKYYDDAGVITYSSEGVLGKNNIVGEGNRYLLGRDGTLGGGKGVYVLPQESRSYYLQNKVNTNSSIYGITNGYQNKINSIPNKTEELVNLDKEMRENRKKYEEVSNLPEVKAQQEIVKNLYEKSKQAYTQTLQDKLDEDKIGWYDKSIGSAVEGVKSLFTRARYQNENEKGTLSDSTTYGDLKRQKVLENSNIVEKTLNSALYEGGRIATSAVINALAPGAGSAKYFENIYNNAYTNAARNGASDSNATGYAMISTVTEYATEKLLGGLTKQLIPGAKTSKVSEIIGEKISKKLGKYPRLVNAIANGISEGNEEFVQEFLDKFYQNLLIEEKNWKSYEDIFSGETLENAVESAIVGFLTGAGAGAFDNSKHTKEKQIYIQNVQDAIKTDLENSTNASNKYVTNENGVLVQNPNYNVTDTTTNTSQDTDLNSLEAQIEALKEKRYKTTNEEQIAELNAKINELQAQLEANKKTNLQQEEDLPFEDTTNIIKTSQNQVKLPKIELKTLEESAKIGNINPNTDEYKFAQAIKNKLGVEVLFKNKVVDENGKEVNGSYNPNTKTIELNINSGQTVQHLLTHELVHALEGTDAYRSLQSLVMDYSKANGGSLWTQALADVANSYNFDTTTDGQKINSEATAMILSEIINDQNFLNELAVSNPNVFTKLYAIVNELIARVTGSQKAYLRSVKAKMELAWKQAIEEKNKNGTNANDAILYSKPTNQAKDNQGNEVNPGMQKYMSKSRARVDEKLDKPLVLVYHTMTNEGKQFNEFNPVGTEYYRFGDQVVNYYTNSKDMSGSYANQDYVMADTKRINNIKEAEDYVKTMNVLGWGSEHNYELIQDDGKYKLIDNSKLPNRDKTWKELYNEANEYRKTLTDKQLNQFKDMYENSSDFDSDGRFNIDRYLKSRGYEFGSEEDNIAQDYLRNIDNKSVYERGIYIDAVIRNAKYHTIQTFENEQDLFRNLKSVNALIAKRQYEGYVNIANPYIVDAEERNWNQVISQSNDFIDELESRVPEDIKNNLTRLYRESENISAEARDNYNTVEKVLHLIDNSTPLDENIRKVNTVVRRVGFDNIEELLDGVPLGVNGWYNLAESLEEEGLIGSATKSFIINEFRLPEQVKNLIEENYNKKFGIHEILYIPDVVKLMNQVGRETTLKDLYNKNFDNYEQFDKYRMPNSYFLEQISSEGNDYLGNELNDIFETRAEIYGADQVGDEIAKAASVAFSKPELIRLWGTSKTTNDIVKEVIASNKDGKTNYDGVIIKNVYDYGGHTDSKKQANDLYVTFASNQFKAKDNENPTKDPDIRYSSDTEGAMNKFIEEKVKPINPNKVERTFEEIRLPKNEVKLPKVNTERPVKTRKDYLNGIENISLDDKTINKITKNMKGTLSLSSKESEEFKRVLSEISSKKNITQDEIREIIDRRFSEKTSKERLDDVIEIKRFLRNYKINVSDSIKTDIPDYSDFRQRNYGKINFSKDGSSVDTAYQELNEMYPNYFSNDIKNPTDQLLEIAYVANLDKYLEKTGYLDEETIKDAAEFIFDSIKDYRLQEDVKEGKLSYDDYLKTTKVENIKFRRKATIQKNRELAAGYLENMADWKDTPLFKQKINTMKRNLRDIMPTKEADILYNEYFAPISKNNATIERETKKYNEKIENLNLNKNESIAVQLLGELKYNPDTTLRSEQVYDFISKHNIDENKINDAVDTFREVYDELFSKVNEVLKENGYSTIGYKKGYFPHFIEEHGKGVIGKLAEKLGWKFNNQKLPTDIAGLTDTFSPGKKWVAFAQHRTGDVTDYNALKGFDNYVRGAMQVIYHTNDIQKLRGLENEIRYQHSEKGVQEKLDEIFNNNDLDTEERQNQIDTLLEGYNNNLGNFVMNLREYTNNLAGKKSGLDRSVEFTMGRNIYNTMNNISSRVSANMVGLNISSALTNFIPITQAWSQISTKNMMKAMKQTIANSAVNDGFIQESDYLTNRIDKSDKLYKTGIEKVSDKAGILFDAIDSFSSQVIVRGKYLENIEKGMSKSEAMNNANEFAKAVMAGRSQGDMPTLFNSKSPITKLFTAFQLEVNNQYGYMFKDLPNDLKNKGLGLLISAFIKMFLGAWLYNKMAEELTGRKSAFSPIDIVVDSVKTAQRDDLSDYAKISSITKDITDESPFVSGLLGGGRLPINAALPSISTIVENATNLKDASKKEKAIKNITKELEKPLFYAVLPFGGGQLKKSKDAAAMYNKKLPIAGSYTSSGNLRFEADSTPIGKAKALLFGSYSSKEAQEYVNSGYKTISSSKIQELKDLGMTTSEYRKYNQELKNAGTKNSDKINYIANSDYTNEQKNIMANAVLKRNDFNINDYNKCDSYDEYVYSRDYPNKHSVIKQITSFDNYMEYKDTIDNIRKNTKNDKEETINYINSLSLSLPQKAMFIKQYYKSFNSYNNQIIQYINSQKLSIKEKTQILTELGFTVKEGRVY